MGTGSITYYTRAESDYQFIKADYEGGRVGEVTRYPGDDAILVDKDDVDACWEAATPGTRHQRLVCNT